jgi:hypothetical protein
MLIESRASRVLYLKKVDGSLKVVGVSYWIA